MGLEHHDYEALIRMSSREVWEKVFGSSGSDPESLKEIFEGYSSDEIEEYLVRIAKFKHVNPAVRPSPKQSIAIASLLVQYLNKMILTR